MAEAANFPTHVAVRAAGMARQPFNDAVKAGFYPCAPQTRRGCTRRFDTQDIIGLSVLQILLDFGVAPRRAGPVACEILARIRQDRIDAGMLEVELNAHLRLTLNLDAIKARIAAAEIANA